jgi:hypothetical protein
VAEVEAILVAAELVRIAPEAVVVNDSGDPYTVVPPVTPFT